MNNFIIDDAKILVIEILENILLFSGFDSHHKQLPKKNNFLTVTTFFLITITLPSKNKTKYRVVQKTK